MIEAAKPGALANGHVSPSGSKNAKENKSPLKAAADLIQTLDKAHAEMNSCAANAARDAEDARRNARAASEIARRYQNRSYPKVQSPFGSVGSPTPGSPSFRLERSMNGDDSGGRSRAVDSSRETNGVGSPFREDIILKHPSSSGRKRKTFKAPQSSSERLAQSHAEDVLSLSLDLERSKQALKSEQRAHDESKASLAVVKSKNLKLEKTNKTLLTDMGTQKEQSQQKIEALEKELANARLRIEAAEEDAQLALDLAKENSEKREQVEIWLQKALEEINVLREQNSGTAASDLVAAAETPKRSVRFADTPDLVPTEEETKTVESPIGRMGKGGASRAMVAAGRQLLRRSLVESDEQNVHTLELTPIKSAERRRRLKESLRDLDEDAHNHMPTSVSDSPNRNAGFESSKLMEEHRAVTLVLQQSGRRLDLGGYWAKEKGETLASDIHLEALARHFCQSVEIKIERQTKEVTDLESLCGYLEQMIGSRKN